MRSPLVTDPAPGVRLTIGARVFHVDVAHPEDRAALRAALSGFAPAAAAQPSDVICTVRRTAGALWTVTTSGAAPQQAATLEDALLAVEWQLVTDMLAHQTGRFHLHGAALLDPAGTTTVLVLGASGVGKTTLTLALMAAGFRPYADDVVLLDADTLIVDRFPRAFHVDANTRRLVSPLFQDRRWEVAGLPAGNCLPLEWASEPVPVGVIILPKGRGETHPRLVPLGVADTAMALLSCTTTLERAPGLALRAAARLAATTASFALHGAGPAADVGTIASAVADRRAGRTS